MALNHQIIFAGFGGQGILFAGKIIAYAGMLTGSEVSWLPSYGPEMRGGTANCSVIISDKLIGSPLVLHPTELVCMNSPSFDRFEAETVPGGKAFIDSTLITRISERTDVTNFYIPATQLAIDSNMPNLANVIITGKLLKETGLFSLELMRQVMEKSVSSTKRDLIDLNMRALEIGYAYK